MALPGARISTFVQAKPKPLKVISRTMPNIYQDLIGPLTSGCDGPYPAPSVTFSNDPTLTHIKNWVVYVEVTGASPCTCMGSITTQDIVRRDGAVVAVNTPFIEDIQNLTPESHTYDGEHRNMCSGIWSTSGLGTAEIIFRATCGALHQGVVALEDVAPGPLYGIVSDLNLTHFEIRVNDVPVTFYALTDTAGDRVMLIPKDVGINEGDRIKVIRVTDGPPHARITKWDYVVI